MKKIIFALPFLIACSINIYSQWSTDPNNNLIVGYGLDPHICSDSAGGCYITYNYNSTSYPRWLALERLDKYGYKPWGINKRILGELQEQWQAEIIEDGEGGVIVSYQDNEWIPPAYFNSKVRLQKIDSAGNFLWGQTGVRVTLTEINQGSNQQVSDGEGGCIIVWADYDGKYWINRINNFGQRVWTDSGKVLGISAYSEQPRIIRAADGNYFAETGEYIYRIRQNGEIMLWESTIEWGLITATPDGGGILHSSIWNLSFYKLIAMRRDTLGGNLWQEPYVEIADSIDINTPISIKPTDGYYFYNWLGNKNGNELVTQYQAIRLDGTKLFNQGSIPISNYPIDASIGNILPSDPGKFVLIWQDYRPEDGVFGQRKDTLNNKLWNSNDVPLYTGMYSDLFAITDGMGGAIGVGWHQFDFSIRTFKVSKNGILGEVITNIANPNADTPLPYNYYLFQNYPNPFNSATVIKYQIPEYVNVQINLYNILGEKISTIYEGERNAGTYTISFSTFELPSGVYFYTLEANSSIEVKKLTILK